MVEVDNGLIVSTQTPLVAEIPGRRAYVYEGFRGDVGVQVDTPIATGQGILQSGAVETNQNHRKDPSNNSKTLDNAVLGDRATPGAETWWESFHVIPRDFDFGNLLSTQTEPIEVYSAFRRLDQDWTAFVNNAGAGVSITGIPAFPYTFVPQSNGALTLTLVVSPSGQPVVDATLDFVFGTVPQTVPVPITLKRVVLFAVQPELPFTERLEWLTEVMPHVDGTEQRHSGRKNPRQLFEWDFILEDGPERAFFHNVIFDWQARIFGLPIWSEATRTDQLIAVDDLTVNVNSTAFADYRVGGLVLIFSSRNTFDVVELASFDATSLTLTSGVLNSYPVGTLVMPLRTGVARRQIQGSRFLSGDARLKMQFRVDDNDVDLADVSPFNSYNSKVLLDGCNSVRGQMSEQFERDIVLFDHAIGIPEQTSPWDVGKRISQLALLGFEQQGLWELRGLLHALRGRQISFYVPSFTNDFTVDGDIAAGLILNVANVGYTQFVQNRQPRNLIRIIYNNGDPDDIRQIVSSSEVDATREALTLDIALAARPASEVEKIMYVEKVRFDSDSIQIRHELGERMWRVTSPIRTVLE